MNHQKNNVHVSGILSKERVNDKEVSLEISICNTQIKSVIERCIWEKYKDQFPNEYQSLTISGVLQSERNDEGRLKYIIKAANIGHFHNVLVEELDERSSQFCGLVKLKKKFDFDTSSKLLLKRLLFETISSEKQVLEAVALRGIVPYFDNIQEGSVLMLKADYVADKNGNQYWRVNHIPEFIA